MTPLRCYGEYPIGPGGFGCCYFKVIVREGLMEKVTLSKDLKEMRVYQGSVPGSGNSRWKDPEVGACLACPRTSWVGTEGAGAGGMLAWPPQALGVSRAAAFERLMALGSFLLIMASPVHSNISPKDARCSSTSSLHVRLKVRCPELCRLLSSLPSPSPSRLPLSGAGCCRLLPPGNSSPLTSRHPPSDPVPSESPSLP